MRLMFACLPSLENTAPDFCLSAPILDKQNGEDKEKKFFNLLF